MADAELLHVCRAEVTARLREMRGSYLHTHTHTHTHTHSLSLALSRSLSRALSQVAARLGELREKRDAEEKVRMQEEAADEAERQRREERERLQEEEERARAKAEIQRFREGKEREEVMGRLLRVWMHWKLARAHRETACKNEERTRFRIEEYERKLEQQRRRRKEEEAALADKEERLRRLRDTVAPEVASDPTRHLALTTAAQAYLDGDRETGVRKFATNDKNFYAGYTMDNLMADTRARLGMS